MFCVGRSLFLTTLNFCVKYKLKDWSHFYLKWSILTRTRWRSGSRASVTQYVVYSHHTHSTDALNVVTRMGPCITVCGSDHRYRYLAFGKKALDLVSQIIGREVPLNPKLSILNISTGMILWFQTMYGPCLMCVFFEAEDALPTGGKSKITMELLNGKTEWLLAWLLKR